MGTEKLDFTSLCHEKVLCTVQQYFCTAICVVSEALAVAEELLLNEDLIGTRHRLQQLHMLRQRAESEDGRVPLEIPEGRMMANQRFQEPPYEILQGYLDDLGQVAGSRS